MNYHYRTLRNRRPPMVVKIQRKRHVTGPMAQPQKADGNRAPDAQA